MNNAEVLAMQGQRIEGFVKLELVRKDGVKIVEEHNMITPAGKHYLLNKSAGKMLDMNGQLFGSIIKQGVELTGMYGNSNSRVNSYNYKNEITNAVLNLTDEQLSKINQSTNFINYFDENLDLASKVVGYANSSLNPLADGKEGTIEDIKGSEAITTNCITRKFKYPDGVATGTINAVVMAPMPSLTSIAGVKGSANYHDAGAPGFTISKCLDKVNPQYANFESLSTSFLPPGVPGFTSETEVLYDYKQDSLPMHKIDLTTGEVTNIENEAEFLLLKDMTTYEIYDYFIEDNFIYLLYNNSSSSIGYMVYDLSSKTHVRTNSLESGYYVRAAKFLKYNDELYVTFAHYQNNYNVICKLTQDSNAYYSTVSEYATTYEGITTLPSGLTNNHVCFGNYGDKYIVYVLRSLGTTSINNYMTAYIVSDLNDIAGTIEDCIPSIRYYNEFVFKNNSLGGILSIGKNTQAESNSEAYSESVRFLVTRDGNKEISLLYNGLMYTPEKSWTNTMSIVKLDTPLTKGASDVLYVTYGYRIK